MGHSKPYHRVNNALLRHATGARREPTCYADGGIRSTPDTLSHAKTTMASSEVRCRTATGPYVSDHVKFLHNGFDTFGVSICLISNFPVTPK